MAYEIHKRNEGEFIVAEERLFSTEDGRLVPETDPDALFLVAVPGREIPVDEARKYGMVRGTKEAEPAEDKAVAEPEADKAVKPRKRTAKKA